MDPQLFQDVLYVIADGVGGDLQLIGNVFGCASGCQQSKHVQFAVSQTLLSIVSGGRWRWRREQIALCRNPFTQLSD